MNNTPTTATDKPGNFLTIPAKIISYIFHPLFIPTYIFLFLMWRFPYEFTSLTERQLKFRLFSVFWMTAFFPAFAVFLLWRLKFSESIFLRTQKDRIAPFVITMFFYWWMYYLSRNSPTQELPEVLKFFYFGIFISTSLGLIVNNFIKISLHAIALGGALTAIVLFAFFYQADLGIDIAIAALVTGVVCTSRFLVSDHTSKEVYSGLVVGIACQLFGYWFV